MRILGSSSLFHESLAVKKTHVSKATAQSNSTSSRKSDVFWAMYMDREHNRERRAKKRHTGIVHPSNRQSACSMKDDDEEYLSNLGVSGISAVEQSFD